MSTDLSKGGAPEVVTGPIEAWLQELWDRGGSDLLLSEGVKPMIRVDGGLVPIEAADVLTAERVEELVSGLLPEDKRTELVRHREVDFSFGWQDIARFRGNAFHQRGTRGAGAARRSRSRSRPSTSSALPPVCRTAVHATARASCSSPGRPARASRRPWRR